MSSPSPQTITKDFTNIINKLSYSKNKGTVFADWLEMTAISLHQVPFLADELPKDETYQEFEDQYLEVAKRYNREELTQFGELFALTVQGIHCRNNDFLGDIYGSLELINKRAGQFFTPFTVSAILAKGTMEDVRQEIEKKGVITMNDPASGAGGTLIAAAYEIANQSIDPRTHVQFYATDISRNCFNMTYIQMCLMDLQAVVHHGNTLSMEIWETRKTPQMLLFEDWLQKSVANQKTNQLVEKMRKFLSCLEEPIEESRITEEIVKTEMPKADIEFTPQQLSLFN